MLCPTTRSIAANGHADVVCILLAAGADADVASNDGATALDVAVARHHAEVEELLRGSKR